MDAAQKAAHDERQKWVTRFQSIEARLARIEAHLNLPPMPQRSSPSSGSAQPPRSASTDPPPSNGTGE